MQQASQDQVFTPPSVSSREFKRESLPPTEDYREHLLELEKEGRTRSPKGSGTLYRSGNKVRQNQEDPGADDLAPQIVWAVWSYSRVFNCDFLA